MPDDTPDLGRIQRERHTGLLDTHQPLTGHQPDWGDGQQAEHPRLQPPPRPAPQQGSVVAVDAVPLVQIGLD
jgi:hypothetical protein